MATNTDIDFADLRTLAEANLRCAGLDAFEIVIERHGGKFSHHWRVWAVSAAPDATGTRRSFLRGPKADGVFSAMYCFLESTAELVAETQVAHFWEYENKQRGAPIGKDGAIVDRTAFRASKEYAGGQRGQYEGVVPGREM